MDKIYGVLTGGAAFIAAIGSFFGMSHRFNNLEKSLDNTKKEVQWKDTCMANREGFQKQITITNEIQKRILDKLDTIETKIGEIKK